MKTFLRKLFRRYPPLTPKLDAIQKEIDELARQGQKELDNKWCNKVMMAALEDMLPIMSVAFFGNKEAENHILIPVICDSDPSKNFNIILQKWGKKLPSPGQLWMHGGAHPDQAGNK